MGNSTTFLTMPALELPGATKVSVFQKYVDFTLETLTAGNSIDVMKVPKGFVPLIAGWVTHTTDATGPEFQMSLGTLTTELVAAALIGSAAAAVVTHIAAPALCTATADETIRVTGSVQDCDAGKVTFFVAGMMNEEGAAK